MNLVGALSIAGLAVSWLVAVGGLLYFAVNIWACANAQAKGGGSPKNRAALDPSSYKTIRAAYVRHRNSAGRGMITLFLGILAGIGFAVAADRMGGTDGWRGSVRAACEGVELCGK